jgi:hypothetical protein
MSVELVGEAVLAFQYTVPARAGPWSSAARMINVVAEHTLVLSVASKRIVTPCMMILSTRPTSSTTGLT